MISGHELITSLPGTELFRLERGRRTKTGQRVLVKSPRHDPPRAGDIAALRSEIDILTNLPIAGVLQPSRRSFCMAMHCCCPTQVAHRWPH